jgi:hypothetical protein
VAAMMEALRGQFDTYDYSVLSLLSYIGGEASQPGKWLKGARTEGAMAVIAAGLRNHDTWLQMLSCEEFEGVSTELASSLTQDMDVWSATDNVLILFNIMRMVAAFYGELRMCEYSTVFPTVKATTGKECAALYAMHLKRLLEGAKGKVEAQGWTSHPHFPFYDEVSGAFNHIIFKKR